MKMKKNIRRPMTKDVIGRETDRKKSFKTRNKVAYINNVSKINQFRLKIGEKNSSNWQNIKNRVWFIVRKQIHGNDGGQIGK